MKHNVTRRNEYQAELLRNRLSKRHKALKRWARRERVTCYRLYDRDIPEIPLAIDLYEFVPEETCAGGKGGCAQFLIAEEARISANDADAIREKLARTYLHIFLYERPYEKDEADEDEWLALMARSACRAVGVAEDHALTKIRRRQKGESQYGKIVAKRATRGVVQERGQLFLVNLSEYLDTGLFLDHRPLRSIVRSSCAGKSVLNLFCYTASFSVFAAEGKARRVESVDLSNTHLDWAKKNFALNGFPPGEKHLFTRGDVAGFLSQKLAEKPDAERTNRYDIIILDPPTFSNSKATRNTLDITRDWRPLVEKCANLLTPNGCLYFSTNARRLKFSAELLPQKTAAGLAVRAREMTAETLDEDFAGTKAHRCWKISVGARAE